MQDEFLVHTREGRSVTAAAPRSAGGRRRALDLLLSRLPAEAAGAPAPPAKASSAMSETIAPPDGFLVGHWTDAVGITGCTA